MPSSCRCNNCSVCDIFGCSCDVQFSVSLQVFVDGMEPVRKPLERMFEDSASEKSVRAQPSLKYQHHNTIVSSLTFLDVCYFICALFYGRPK